MKIGTFLLCLLLFAICITGCASVQEFIKKNVQLPKVAFSGAKISGLSFESVDLLFDLEVTNPNPVGIHLVELDYDFLLNNNSFLKGKQEHGLEINARSTDIVQIPLSLNFVDIYNTFRGLINQDSTTYEISAGLSFNIQILGAPQQISIRKRGTLPLLKPPKISLASLKLHNLNLTGADLSLNVKLINPNAFEFIVKRMEYDFEINGSQWLSGNSQKNLQISAKDESLLNFPISLNFFQIGRSVAQLLKNNQPLEYRFKGGINLDSSLPLLGAVHLSFDRSGQIRIQK